MPAELLYPSLCSVQACTLIKVVGCDDKDTTIIILTRLSCQLQGTYCRRSGFSFSCQFWGASASNVPFSYQVWRDIISVTNAFLIESTNPAMMRVSTLCISGPSLRNLTKAVRARPSSKEILYCNRDSTKLKSPLGEDITASGFDALVLGQKCGNMVANGGGDCSGKTIH